MFGKIDCPCAISHYNDGNVRDHGIGTSLLTAVCMCGVFSPRPLLLLLPAGVAVGGCRGSANTADDAFSPRAADPFATAAVPTGADPFNNPFGDGQSTTH